MQIIRQQGFARAGLIGNPSDGYHGKTISFLVKDFHADAILYEWEDLELILSQEDRSRFGSVRELARDVRLHGYYGGVRLVKATIKKFVDFCLKHGLPLHERNFSIRYESNIPRQVGLAGSSAIIVATLRALMEFYGVQIPLHLQPSLALSVETDELGIVGGLQDRVIQAYGGLVYMDFAREVMREEGGYRFGVVRTPGPGPAPAALPGVQRGRRRADGGHARPLAGPLRARRSGRGGGDAEVRPVGRRGEDRLAGRRCRPTEPPDGRELRHAPQHLRFAAWTRPHDRDRAASRSQHKFAGSGGAIVGVYRDEAMYRRLKRDLEALGCRVLKPVIA